MKVKNNWVKALILHPLPKFVDIFGTSFVSLDIFDFNLSKFWIFFFEGTVFSKLPQYQVTLQTLVIFITDFTSYLELIRLIIFA